MCVCGRGLFTSQARHQTPTVSINMFLILSIYFWKAASLSQGCMNLDQSKKESRRINAMGVTLVIFHYIDFLLGFEALIQSQYLTYGSFILSFLSFFKYIYIWETFKQTKQVKCNIVYLIMSDTRLYTVELPN